MSRFSKLIDNLENLHQQDIKNSAKVYGITATLASRLEEILNDLDDQPQKENQPKDKQPQKLLTEVKITKEELIQHYGNYHNAYEAYQKAYGIKCRKGWTNLLKAIQGLTPPDSLEQTPSISLEQRVDKLEKIVKTLVQILLDNNP